MPSRLEILEKMVAASPNDPFPMYGLALEYRSAGRDEDALRAFEKLRDAFPQYVPQYLMAGQLCEKLGRRDVAREWFQKGVVAAQGARDMHALGELEGALTALR